jgi:hypothetical protein
VRWRKCSHREGGVSVKASTEWTSSCLVGRRYGGQRNRLLRGVSEELMHVVGLVRQLGWLRQSALPFPIAHRSRKRAYPLSLGIATFEQTFPLSAFAALSKLSVPALYRTSPSLLNPRHLQLPSGCLRVRQAVSISPRPFSEAANDSRRALDPGSRTPPS